MLVLGDVMLDRYIVGDSQRISPEAPVPVVEPTHEACHAGGAANLAANLAALGLRVRLVGVTGEDIDRDALLDLLPSSVNIEGLVPIAQRPTTAKTRVVVGTHQLIRIDYESKAPLVDAEVETLQSALTLALDAAPDAVVICDYGKGAAPSNLCRQAIEWANQRSIPVFVDPTTRDLKAYAGATVIKPNRYEFENMVGEVVSSERRATAARNVMKRFNIDAMLITLGPAGLTWVTQDNELNAPAENCPVFDVTGAGDTALAAFIDAHLRNWSVDTALGYVNHAAANVVSRVGTCIVDPSRFAEEYRDDNAASPAHKPDYDSDARIQRVLGWQREGQRIVFTNGCFDLLHRGHLQLLAEARAAGDRLVVAINTDESIRQLKGSGRPIQRLAVRAAVLESLQDVDVVVPFSDETPIRLIETLRPNVLVKGADYSRAEVIGGDIVEQSGGEVLLIPLVQGESTTTTIERMRRLSSPLTDKSTPKAQGA